MISYGRQTIEADDIEAVLEVLGAPMITQGPGIEAFERALAEYTGSEFAVCCSSGTAALHLAYLAAGLGPGDKVLTSPNTFLATANAALYVGAEPVFADIDPDSGNIDPEDVARKISTIPGIRAVVPVHYSGLPSELQAVSEAAGGIAVIEDACHALGARWRDKDGRWERVGACSSSLMTIFSFHPVKSITTAEGGAVTTNDRDLYERLKMLRNHGMRRDGLAEGTPAPWYYEMHELGYNYRISDMQCALGKSQLKKIERFIRRRAEISALYTTLLKDVPPVKTPVEGEGRSSAHHLYPVRIDFESLGISKRRWFETMISAGVRPQVHYIPVHLQPYYRERFGYRAGDFPVAERFYAEEVSLPIYPLLTDGEVRKVSETVRASLASTAEGAYSLR